MPIYFVAHDFPFEHGQSFGEWLHAAMHEALTFEDASWALDRVHRIEDRLQAGRPPGQRLQVEVPWMDEPTAFTAPGPYIYFTRRLFEQCPTDEMAAFIVAHELAHHDLGHVALFRGWADKIARLPGATLFALFFFALEKRLYGPEKECHADRHGLDLCLTAGYAANQCLEIFDIMEHLALDRGDLDMVYGPDVDSDDELDENANWTTKAQIWAWQRRRGYLPIRDRRQMLLKHLATCH
jgi:predicted Zn-dependent protease